MTFPGGLRALNHAEFRTFFTAQLVGLVGSWMQTVAQSWLVLQLTNSPLKLGLLGTLQFSPVLIFSMVAGALADRVRKRRLLIATQVTLGCQAFVLALLIASGRVEYWHVAVLGFIGGVAATFDLPTRQSYVTELVGRDDLLNAVALNSAAFNVARIVGPAVAGLLIARIGVAPAFLLNSAAFVVVILSFSALTHEGAPRGGGGTTVIQEIVEGITYAVRTPRIRLVLGLLFAVSSTVFNFNVYVPLLARNVLGLGAEGFGFLMASLGVGAVCGALSLGSLRARQPSLGVISVAAALACGGLALMSLVRQPWTAVPGLFVVGYFAIIVIASCNTALQVSAPDELRGRVMSIYTLVWGGVYPIGAFLVGWVSEGWGVSRAFLFAGSFGLAVLATLLAWWSLRRE